MHNSDKEFSYHSTGTQAGNEEAYASYFAYNAEAKGERITKTVTTIGLIRRYYLESSKIIHLRE